MSRKGHVQFQGECGGVILQSYPAKESNFFLLSDEPLDDGYPYMHLLFDLLIMYQCRVIGQ
ncbi:hypothetical protein [Methanobrevibacter sp.]|uniref:hypothetical protein n=1 Tax=Methanobrevibacter sp. TaxID=66852 RepID=UPI002E79BFFA|nr:hypothetical protein [Methanobrevibacter sp.]MEE0024268.1 hypothetical protein [Methanobrevibacter sp.]